MNTIIATTGASQSQSEECSAYIAALRVTEHSTRHLSVDIGARRARAAQRAFSGAVNRLVKLIGREINGHLFEIRFLDARESAKACRRSAGDDSLAVQITVIKDHRIVYDVAVRHCYGGSVACYIERCRGEKTSVIETPESRIMSVHARRIIENQKSVN